MISSLLYVKESLRRDVIFDAVYNLERREIVVMLSTETAALNTCQIHYSIIEC